MKRVLTLDRGNHALKAALFEDGVICERRRRAAPRLSDVAALLRRFEPDGLAVSCVVPAWRAALEEMLDSRAWSGRRLWAGHDCPLPFELDLENPETVGADRLCAAAAAVEAGARSAVIVDAGTAFTVDLLAAGIFRGGSIMPGPALMLRSLRRGTAALPPFDARALLRGEEPAFPGRDTQGALAAGVYNACIGAVRHLVRLSLERLPAGAPVFLTGGAAAPLARRLQPAPIEAPDLVLEGLNYLYMNRFRDR